MTSRHVFSAPFLKLYALTLLFFSANAILSVILPLQSEKLGASNSDVGIIMGAYMFTCMFFRPYAGYLVHKHGPVFVLRILLIVNGLALLLYVFTGLGGYLVARVMQGICTAFFSMALQMGIIDSLTEEQRSEGLSLYSLFTYFPSVLGPVFAIGIWQWSGMNGFAIVIFGIALVTALFGFSFPTNSLQPTAGSSKEPPQMREALKQIFRRRSLQLCSFLMFTASVLFGAVTVYIPLYSQQITGGNAGIFLMIQAFIIVIARLTTGKRIPSDGMWYPSFIGGIFLIGATGAILLALSPSWGLLAFYSAALLIGIAQALLYPTLVSFLTFVLSGSSRNVLLGLFIAMADLGISMGGMLMGPIADQFSYSAMYGTGAAVLLIAGSIAILGRRISVQ